MPNHRLSSGLASPGIGVLASNLGHNLKLTITDVSFKAIKAFFASLPAFAAVV